MTDGRLRRLAQELAWRLGFGRVNHPDILAVLEQIDREATQRERKRIEKVVGGVQYYGVPPTCDRDSTTVCNEILRRIKGGE